MRSLSLSSFSLLFITSCFTPAALATVACAGGTWDAGIVIDLRYKAGKSSGKVNSDDCTPNVYLDPWSKDNAPKVKVDTKIPEDGKMQKKTSETAGNKYTCDHLVELQMLKEIMEKPGGACDEATKYAAEHGAPAALEKLSIIRSHTWKHKNLFMVEVAAEKRKGNTVNNPTTAIGGLVWFKINELHSYVVDNQGVSAIQTAAALDAEIKTQFPESSTTDSVAATWATYTGLVTAAYATRKAQAEKQLCSLKQRAAKAGGGSTSTTRHKRAPTLSRFARRYLSSFLSVDSGPSISFMPGGIETSLTARARRGAARSGPHAPPGRCCPAPNQPQKKVVPRSKVKNAKPPAKKPRRPTQRPAPRPANKKKQVAKRPASRARREAGKPRVQKRSTPKRKPKSVPKPTRRPRGKPRQRRRRR